MKPLVIFLCCLVQIFLVAGQLFLKRAMSTPKIGWKWFFLGIGNFTLWFFIWLGVLSGNELSQVFLCFVLLIELIIQKKIIERKFL